MTRELSLTLLTCAATAWALVMVVGGAWLLLDGAGRWPILTPAGRTVGGILAITAGQFLFMYLVADRWFPRAVRAITWPLEIAASLVLLGGAAWGLYQIGRVMLAAGS
jgi:hypothetical protein